MDQSLVDRALLAFGEAVNVVEPLRLRFWHERGLTLVQVGLLFQLLERDAQSISELADVLRVRPATVTGLADRLERGGYLRRSGDPSDRRVIRVYLTSTGRRVIEQIRAESHTYLDRAFETLGTQRVEALATLLEELVTAVDTEQEAELAGATARRKM